MLDIRPPDDADAVRASARLNSEERPQGQVWTHLRKDGSRLRTAIHARDIVFEARPRAWFSARTSPSANVPRNGSS
jgi:hypothetical protein